MPVISEYTNYREYLIAFYTEAKTRNPYFSYQLFAQKAGIKSKGFLFNVIKGKRNLTKSNIFGLIQAMKLNKDEANYFENLVSFNQSQNEKERSYFYEKLLSIKSVGKNAWNPQIVRKDQYEFYTKLYHSAVRALIDMYPFKDNYEWLAKNIYPQITPSQAKKSVQLLENLGFIAQNGDGFYKITNKSIATPKEVGSVVFLNYHREAGKAAIDAITEIPKEKHNISGMTLGLSKKTYEEICEEIRDFRKRISQKVEEDNGADRAYQLNFQFFPLSTIEKNGSKNE